MSSSPRWDGSTGSTNAASHSTLDYLTPDEFEKAYRSQESAVWWRCFTRLGAIGLDAGERPGRKAGRSTLMFTLCYRLNFLRRAVSHGRQIPYGESLVSVLRIGKWRSC